MADFRRKRVLLIGHSHIPCLITAQARLREPSFDMDSLYLHKSSAGKDLFADAEGLKAYIRSEVQSLGRQMSDDGTTDYDCVVLCLGGNTHNTLGLIKLNPPIDYVLGANENLGTDGDAFLVPERIVHDIIRGRVLDLLDGMGTIGALFAGKTVCIESPPPIGDDTHVRAHLDEYFIQAFPEGYEIASPELRYKLWRTASAIYRNRCAEIGMPYLECPASVLVDGMYLRKEGYPDNATHGNAWYGERVLENLGSWLEARRRDAS